MIQRLTINRLHCWINATIARLKDGFIIRRKDAYKINVVRLRLCDLMCTAAGESNFFLNGGKHYVGKKFSLSLPEYDPER